MWRPKVPISVAVGEPIEPTLPATELTALLHSRMQHLLEQVQDAYGPYPPGEFWVPHRLGGGAPSLAEANQMDAEEAAREGGPPRAAAVRRERRSRRDGTGLPHAGDRRLDGGGGLRNRITYLRTGEHPDRGGAVVAINHTSYIDFLPAALAAYTAAAAAAVHDQGGDARR